MFVPMKDILLAAQEGGYGVTAPNVFGEDTICAAIEAAEELKSPMILDFGMMGSSEKLIRQTRMIEEMAKAASVPICLNQDHGRDFKSAMWCIRAGFTSVMADRSTLPFEDNVAQVSEIVNVAHAVDVTVEAELGHVGVGAEPDEDADLLTNPDEAVDFVAKTGIDCLAVAIGTAHGLYKGNKTPKLDFPRLAAIRKVVKVPLVLHGGSSSGDENLAKACREGIAKVNLCTDLLNAGNKAIVDSGFPTPPPGRYSVTGTYKEGYKNMLIHYMKLFGQCGKA